MTRAGFTTIQAGAITFGKDGRWYCDGEPITNRAICRLYARALTVEADGTARLVLGADRAVVHLEDTPWVVRRVEGDPSRGFRVTLNDDSEEPLALQSLRVGPDDVLYCRIKERHEARFLRPAQYQLLLHAEPAPDGGYRLRSAAVTRRLVPPTS